MNVVHIFSNLVLIYGWGPIPSMGVLGVSISTALSKGLGLLLVFYLFKTQLNVKLSWSYLKPFPKRNVKTVAAHRRAIRRRNAVLSVIADHDYENGQHFWYHGY